MGGIYPGPTEEGLSYQRLKCSLYPLVNRFWVMRFRPVLVFHHPDSVKVILKTTEPKPTSQTSIYGMGMAWLGEGLLMANGDKWARNRRLLTPAFHFDILQPYVKVYNEAVDILMVKIEEMSKNGCQSFELFSHIGLLSLDIILKCAFSYESNCQVLGKPYLYPDFIFYRTQKGKIFRRHCDFVHSVSEDIIDKRRQTLEKEGLPNKTVGNKKSRYLDFLDILLTAKDDNGTGLTRLEIRNEVDTFLFEGHDTTTSSMCWTLYSLAEHQEYQQRVQAEIDELMMNRDSDYIENSDLQKLEYLTLCIKEGMRLHSPVFFIQRITTKEITVEGMKIPADTAVAIELYNLHHNAVVWENPMEFQPERFLPENIAKRDSYAFVPFSAGPRNCIGQHFAMNEQKVILARLLHRYNFKLEPNHVVRKKLGVVMRAENGIRVVATPRKTCMS
ncbi:hypothetical protein KUTeg_002668 [Tegillarca granosa]|uniref:Cytochrome P450 n=1 Tax=Tegillarca granosa TaxID=220873 RepID=A0ABQ9FV28_TEGGR|nr:hypothetical protein KUTeg_002668 [Tegillarca granosa]